MKNCFTLLVVILTAFSLTAAADTSSTESLSSLMGALNKVISEKTKVAGKDEAVAKITPPAAKIYEALENDLELCQTTRSQEPEVIIIEKDGVKVEFKKFDLKIFGEKCPLDVSISLNTSEQTPEAMAADFIMKVVFKSEAYIEKYKMKFVEATGTITAKAKKEGPLVVIPAHVSIASRGESTELGPIAQSVILDFKIEANLEQFQFGMTMEQKANIQYSGKNQTANSRMKMTGFTQPEVYFGIDDKEVSESEFQAFMQSFTLPGMVSEKDPDAPDGKGPTSCSLVAYDKKSMTVAELKIQMEKGALPPAGQLMKAQSCSSNLNIPFKNADKEYSGKLNFGDEWISFGAGSSVDPQATSSSVYVLYGDSAVLTRETSDMVLGLQCKAVPSCP